MTSRKRSLGNNSFGTRVFTFNSPRTTALRGTVDRLQQAGHMLTELDPADFPTAP